MIPMLFYKLPFKILIKLPLQDWEGKRVLRNLVPIAPHLFGL